MKQIYWENLKTEIDRDNPFSPLYISGSDSFYVEPIFYTKLEMMVLHHPSKKEIILKEMERLVKKNHHIVFTGDFDNPQVHKENFIYLELEDVTNPLMIFVEDKSRGSDYGD